METPVERSRSMAAPSASPDMKAQFNPLVSASTIEDATTADDEFQALRMKFKELDEGIQGSVLFHCFRNHFILERNILQKFPNPNFSIKMSIPCFDKVEKQKQQLRWPSGIERLSLEL